MKINGGNSNGTVKSQTLDQSSKVFEAVNKDIEVVDETKSSSQHQAEQYPFIDISNELNNNFKQNTDQTLSNVRELPKPTRSYDFVYEPSFVDESINYVRNALVYVEELISTIARAATIAIMTKIPGLTFLTNNILNENFEVIKNYEQVINDMKKSAQNNFNSINFDEEETIKKVIDAFANDEISEDEFIKISNQYMHYILEECPEKYDKLIYASSNANLGDLITYKMGIKNPQERKEIIDKINLGFAKYMIDNDYMYTGKGVVEYINSFNGMLAMFGVRMGYDNKEFDQPEQGLYLGTRQQQIQVVDCCNLYDYAARCTGLDLYAFGAGNHYNYGKDINGYNNFTPENEYYAEYGDEYFFNAKPGDIMEMINEKNKNAGHLRIITGKDKNGYYTVENGKGMEYRYYTYEELKESKYHISNMDAVYRNTTSGNMEAYYTKPSQWKRYELSTGAAEQIRYNGGSVFLTPEVFKEELNLDDEYITKLTEQYNKRNQRNLIDKEI